LEAILSKTPIETNATDDKLYVIRSSINQVAAVVESSQPGVLVLNEWFISAWKAKVNGKSKQTLRVNQWQIGLPLLAGTNIVEFIYRPTVFWWLMILNHLTWLVVITLVLARIIRLIIFARESAAIDFGDS
jgi:uncharacterized membrane protein YfhO